MSSHRPGGSRRNRSRAKPGGLRCVVAGLEPQPGGQFRKGQADLLRPFCGHPPDQVVVGLETMRIFERHLGFANTAQPIQGPRQYHRRAVTS